MSASLQAAGRAPAIDPHAPDAPDEVDPAKAARATQCFHCGAAVDASTTSRTIEGEDRSFCSAACADAAAAIDGAGLADFYRLRQHRGESAPLSVDRADIEAYQLPRVEEALTGLTADGMRSARLSVEGMRCAGCAWLVKRLLEGRAGVAEARVDFALRRVEVLYEPAAVQLYELVSELSGAGYAARPYSPDAEETAIEEERKSRLRGLGISAILGMQVMAAGLALHIGDWYGMEPVFRELFRWLALGLTIPVLIWPARQFYTGAWLSLKHRQLTMDVPVALGLTLAFLGSVHATMTGGDAVYFDSIVMFVLLLSGARYLELIARRRAGAAVRGLARGAPLTAWLREAGDTRRVPAAQLKRGDCVVVKPGELVPADGVVVRGESSVDRSVLTGESRAESVAPGDRIIAGTTNHAGALEFTVEDAGDDTVLARISGMAEAAARGRAKVAELADRAAAYFVAATIVIATGVAAFWLWVAPELWISTTVAVLVVTCPCALSLATPAAMTSALGALTRVGLMPARPDVVERMVRVTHFIVDKTGTLTAGHLQVVKTVPRGGFCPAHARRVAAALEADASHPIARALRDEVDTSATPCAQELTVAPAGVCGIVDGVRYWLGSDAFICDETGLSVVAESLAGEAPAGSTMVVMARGPGGSTDTGKPDTGGCCCTSATQAQATPAATVAGAELVAVFVLTDEVRPGAKALVSRLQARGIQVTLASGDSETAVASLAHELGIARHVARQTPDDKLALAAELKQHGEVVGMLGDGVNDAPVLAAADLAIAVGTGAQAARSNADAVLVSDAPEELLRAIDIAARTRRVIKQNLLWAAAYNVVALPAAAAGMVPPWAAAIGMSLSSLVVVGNALRIR